MKELGPLKHFDMRADAETIALADAIGRKWGISRSAAVRYAIRKTAEVEGILDGFAPEAPTLHQRPGPKRGKRRPAPPRPAAGGPDA